MGSEDRRSKATPETKAEAARLRELWETRSHPNQAEFGELYEIGNQSAVGQFLRGVTPLSLKAARGFATGLQCNIEDFSPRLAAQASAIANMVPGDHLSPDVALIAHKIDSLPGEVRERVLKVCQEALRLAQPNGIHEARKVPQRRTK